MVLAEWTDINTVDALEALVVTENPDQAGQGH